MEQGAMREETPVVDMTALAVLLAEQAAQLTVKHEALRNLAQAIQVAQDALRPLADNRPVSGPALRSLVTIALMSLGQASEAVEELEEVAGSPQIFAEGAPR